MTEKKATDIKKQRSMTFDQQKFKSRRGFTDNKYLSNDNGMSSENSNEE